MPILLPYEPLTERAFALIDEGNSLEGIHELYNAWLSGSYQAKRIFEGVASIDANQFAPMAAKYCKESVDDETSFRLGLCHLTGVGVPKSYSRAEAILTALSEKGITKAQNNLGWMYREGRAGLELKSQAERDVIAFEWYTQAARAGFAAAQNNLGWMYRKGCAGLELKSQAKRDVIAVEWYNQAARAGLAAAQYGLAWMYQEGRAGLELESQAERDVIAVKWYTQAAQTGFALAQNNLARMYKYRRAGLELSQAERDVIVIEWYLKAVQSYDATAAWNLAMFYKKQNKELNALNFLSIAAYLYGKSAQDTQDIIQGLTYFKDSPIKNYAQARIHTVMNDDAAVQCAALDELQKPSEYELLFDCDMQMLQKNPKFMKALLNRVSQYASQSNTLDHAEKLSLVRLILKYIDNQLKNQYLENVASEALDISTELCDLLFNHGLHVYLPLLVDDKETDKTLATVVSSLLSFLIMEHSHKHKLTLLFIKLLVILPANAAIWQEDNLVRLCCALMTCGQYTLSQVNTQLLPDQLKTLLMHCSHQQVGSKRLDEDELKVDETGLIIMSRYGIALVDQTVQQQAQTIINRFSATSSALPMLNKLHQHHSPRLNPLMKELDFIVKTKDNHKVLIHLLQLNDKLANIPSEHFDDLCIQTAQLLVNSGLSTSKQAQAEMTLDSIGSCSISSTPNPM